MKYKSSVEYFNTNINPSHSFYIGISVILSEFEPTAQASKQQIITV